MCVCVFVRALACVCVFVCIATPACVFSEVSKHGA